MTGDGPPWSDLPHPADDAPTFQHDVVVRFVPASRTGPTPPHSLEAEREVLAAALVDPNAVELLAELGPHEFYFDRHAILFQALLSLRADGVAIDPVTLQQALKDRGDYEKVGGARAIGELLDRAGTVANVAAYVRIVRDKARVRRVVDAARRLEVEGLGDVDDVEAFTAQAEATFRAACDEGRPSGVDLRAMGDIGDWMESPPPPRPILLVADQGEPFMPDGKVCCFIGAGGSGKTFALTQLALSIATGTPWLGTYRPHAKGRVLLALGEETVDEVRRRIWQCSRLEDYERSEARRLIYPLGLSGTPVSLLQRTAEQNYGPTAWFDLLVRRLEAAGPWRCLILDPWSRWGGPDAENDAHAATRGVELLERLTKLPGRPAVVIAHHTRKRMTPGRGPAAADESRGSSALVDGARWVANLSRLDEKLLEVRVTKANYTVPGAPLHLARAKGGVLRAATPVEVEEYLEARRR